MWTAGEIEDEWEIDPILLTNISFKSYITQLCWEYFKVMSSQHIIDDIGASSIHVMKREIENLKNEFNLIMSYDAQNISWLIPRA